uniref:Uncharacterized protein n=1 Tax=Zea mays TaxID=4577 RepID=A0A804PFY4_MAIZE
MTNSLYPHPNIDLKKLCRLILESKLASCHSDMTTRISKGGRIARLLRPPSAWPRSLLPPRDHRRSHLTEHPRAPSPSCAAGAPPGQPSHPVHLPAMAAVGPLPADLPRASNFGRPFSHAVPHVAGAVAPPPSPPRSAAAPPGRFPSPGALPLNTGTQSLLPWSSSVSRSRQQQHAELQRSLPPPPVRPLCPLQGSVSFPHCRELSPGPPAVWHPPSSHWPGPC